MKKIFSLALAGAMIAGLAATSFAAVTAIDLSKEVLKYDSDGKAMAPITTNSSGITNSIEYGKSAYYQIFYTESTATPLADFVPVDTYADVERLKVKAKWEMGADLVDSVSVVKKNIAKSNVTAGVIEKTGSDYAYFVEIKLKASTSTSDADVIGTLEFTNSKAFIDGDTATQGKIDNEVDVAFTVFYNNNYNNGDAQLFVDSDNVKMMKWDTTYVVKFDYDDEVEFTFGTDPNEGTFTVDVSGQGKLLINFNTKVDEAIAAANPTAKIKALNFNNVTFNRTGEFLYEWEDGGYIYQVIDGQLYTMPNATFDGDEYAFNTRTLGSYVFSDIELVNPEIVVETPEVEAPEVNNPGTGAAV